MRHRAPFVGASIRLHTSDPLACERCGAADTPTVQVMASEKIEERWCLACVAEEGEKQRTSGEKKEGEVQ